MKLWNLAGRIWGRFPRGFALFLGSFSLLNLIGNLRSPGFDANLWWIDLRVLPATVAQLLILCGGISLLFYAVHPPQSWLSRAVVGYFVGLLFLFAGWNTLEFYSLLLRGIVHPLIPLPLSFLLLAGLGLILCSIWKSPVAHAASNTSASLPALCIFFGLLVLFPLMQMFCFGKTDYRRRADVAVVFGARVYADGRPSDAVADRVRTACKLYRDGLVKKLLFSGGPGDGAIHETEGMKRVAIQLGVRPEDILLDKSGLNTQATVKNSEQFFAELHASRVLVVSHFYHLPRIKLAYQRRGWDVYTVPAKESYFLRQLPYNMAREVAALWVYYLRPLAETHATNVRV